MISKPSPKPRHRPIYDQPTQRRFIRLRHWWRAIADFYLGIYEGMKRYNRPPHL